MSSTESRYSMPGGVMEIDITVTSPNGDQYKVRVPKLACMDGWEFVERREEGDLMVWGSVEPINEGVTLQKLDIVSFSCVR